MYIAKTSFFFKLSCSTLSISFTIECYLCNTFLFFENIDNNKTFIFLKY